MEQATAPNVVEITKRCTKCGEIKPVSEFRNRTRKGRRPYSGQPCRACEKVALAAWRKKNEGMLRKQRLIRYEPDRRSRAEARKLRPARYTEDGQLCHSCKERKPVSEFIPSLTDKSGFGSLCKPCNKTKSSEWLQKNKAMVKARMARKHKLKKYGLTPEVFSALVDSQGGKCGICRIDFTKAKIAVPYVDHCHDTNIVRGLLCQKCNSGLGMLGDKVENLEAAISYIKRARGDE